MPTPLESSWLGRVYLRTACTTSRSQQTSRPAGPLPHRERDTSTECNGCAEVGLWPRRRLPVCVFFVLFFVFSSYVSCGSASRARSAQKGCIVTRVQVPYRYAATIKKYYVGTLRIINFVHSNGIELKVLRISSILNS